MKNLLIVLAALALLAKPSLAQPLGVGIKVPLQAFVFVGLTERFAIEVGLPIGLSVGGLAAVADLKLFLSAYEIIDLVWKPFVGAGASAGVRSQGSCSLSKRHFKGLWG